MDAYFLVKYYHTRGVFVNTPMSTLRLARFLIRFKFSVLQNSCSDRVDICSI